MKLGPLGVKTPILREQTGKVEQNPDANASLGGLAVSPGLLEAPSRQPIRNNAVWKHLAH